MAYPYGMLEVTLRRLINQAPNREALTALVRFYCTLFPVTNCGKPTIVRISLGEALDSLLGGDCAVDPLWVRRVERVARKIESAWRRRDDFADGRAWMRQEIDKLIAWFPNLKYGLA